MYVSHSRFEGSSPPIYRDIYADCKLGLTSISKNGTARLSSRIHDLYLIELDARFQCGQSWREYLRRSQVPDNNSRKIFLATLTAPSGMDPPDKWKLRVLGHFSPLYCCGNVIPWWQRSACFVRSRESAIQSPKHALDTNNEFTTIIVKISFQCSLQPFYLQ